MQFLAIATYMITKKNWEVVEQLYSYDVANVWISTIAK